MPYHREPPRSIEQLCAETRAVLARGGGITVLTDFDATVSAEAGDGSDPFATAFDPRAAHALASLQAHGQVVGVISNRGAGQIRARCRQAGFAHTPFIVGTYGYELLPPHGAPQIDHQFAPYHEIVTRVLRGVRVGLLRRAGLDSERQPDIETLLATPYGPVYLEMKGICADYPEGLAHEYNFNRIAPATRASLVRAAEDDARAALAREDPTLARALAALWGSACTSDPSLPGPCSWALKPILARAKAYGMVRLLRAIRAEGGWHGPACLVVYAGDHRHEDGHAMWAGKALERLTQGRMRFAGIWADAGRYVPGAPDESDLRVGGASGVAQTFARLATVVASEGGAQRATAAP